MRKIRKSDFRNPILWAWLISLIANVFKLCRGAVANGLPLFHDDTLDYETSASMLLHGMPGTWRTPGYPTLMNLLGHDTCWAHAGEVALLLLQTCVFLAALIWLARIVLRLGGSRWLAAALLVFMGAYPQVVYFNCVVISESLCISMGVFLLCTSLRFVEKPSALGALKVSGWIFLLLLMRPINVFVIPLALIFFVVVLWRRWRPLLASLACILALVGLVKAYSAWMFASYGVHALTYASLANNNSLVADAGAYEAGHFDNGDLYRQYWLTKHWRKEIHDRPLFLRTEFENRYPELERAQNRAMAAHPDKIAAEIFRRFVPANLNKLCSPADYSSFGKRPNLPVAVCPVSAILLLCCLGRLGKRYRPFWLWVAALILGIWGTAWVGAMSDWGRLVMPGWGWLMVSWAGLVLAFKKRRLKNESQD